MSDTSVNSSPKKTYKIVKQEIQSPSEENDQSFPTDSPVATATRTRKTDAKTRNTFVNGSLSTPTQPEETNSSSVENDQGAATTSVGTKTTKTNQLEGLNFDDVILTEEKMNPVSKPAIRYKGYSIKQTRLERIGTILTKNLKVDDMRKFASRNFIRGSSEVNKYQLCQAIVMAKFVWEGKIENEIEGNWDHNTKNLIVHKRTTDEDDNIESAKKRKIISFNTRAREESRNVSSEENNKVSLEENNKVSSEENNARGDKDLELDSDENENLSTLTGAVLRQLRKSIGSSESQATVNIKEENTITPLYRSIVFERSCRAITMVVNSCSDEKIGTKLKELTLEDERIGTNVFMMGPNRNRRYSDGEIYRCFDNDRMGSFPESQFLEQSIVAICSLDSRLPIKFKIDYVPREMNELSDDDERHI